VPQNIPGGEIYQALEKGTIDAAEWVGPYDDEKLGFNKVAPFYAYPGWWEGGPQLDFYVNTRPTTACRPSTRPSSSAPLPTPHRHAGQVRRRNPAALKRLVAGGTKLFRFPKDVMDAASRSRWRCTARSRQEPELEEGLRRLLRVPPRRQPVVPLHRSRLRRLHAAQKL
jgi:TRAP-type mannitol/chloroaromatic compound transport system substrate-binding protein